MKAIKKLKSNRGATMIFAMAMFLVAIVISVSLISVSMSATKTAASVLEDEQAYLAVSSAARILQDEIESKDIIQTDWKESFDGHASGYRSTKITDKTTEPETITTYEGEGLPSGEPVSKMLIGVLRGTAPEKITVISPDDLECDVEIVISVKADKSLKAVLNAYDKNDAEKLKPLYTTSLVFYSYIGTAEVKGLPEGATEMIVVKEVTKARWSIYGESIKRGVGNEEDEEDDSQKTEKKEW